MDSFCAVLPITVMENIVTIRWNMHGTVCAVVEKTIEESFYP